MKRILVLEDQLEQLVFLHLLWNDEISQSKLCQHNQRILSIPRIQNKVACNDLKELKEFAQA